MAAVARSDGSGRTVWALRVSAGGAQPSITGGTEVSVVIVAVEQLAAAADLTELRRHAPNLSPLPSGPRQMRAAPLLAGRDGRGWREHDDNPARCCCGGVWSVVILGRAARWTWCRAVASEPVAVGAGPLEDAVRRHPVAPGGAGLESVVSPAEGGEVRGRGGTGLWSALGFGVVVVLDDVVDVAAPRGSGAPREDAGPVAENDLFAERSGISYAGVESSASRSMTGLMVTLVRESPHQDWIWSRSTSRWPSSIRPVGPKTVC